MKLPLTDACVEYLPAFIGLADSLVTLQQLYQQTIWQQAKIPMFGKLVTIPRLQAWYGDQHCQYCYSSLQLTPHPWTPLLLALNSNVSEYCQTEFNSVLINCYRNHQDSVSWHSDDEDELGDNPIIASLSFGATRNFHFKHKSTGESFKLPLQSGSLLVMKHKTQVNYQHALPKSRIEKSMRINLTFRKILP